MVRPVGPVPLGPAQPRSLGDGLELDGRLLYVGRNVNEVDAVELSHSLANGDVVATITDPSFDTPDTPYSITRVDALRH